MKSVLVGVVAALAVSASGCNLFPEPDQRLRLGVEGLEAPSRNPAANPLSVVVLVVTGGCKIFDRFETSRSAAGATLTAVGRDVSEGRACTDEAIVTPHTVRFDRPFASTYTITVNRFNQKPLTATIQID